MAAINFPDSPTVNDEFVVGGRTWKWTGVFWEFVGVGSTLLIVEKTAPHTLVLSDKDKLIEMNSSSAITLSVPPNDAEPFPIGSQINILQTGTGQTTIAPKPGGVTVTVNGTPGLKLRAQWSSATLIKRAENVWVLAGDLVL
jgi:hypothetical protein